jgi:hypothetical protein
MDCDDRRGFLKSIDETWPSLNSSGCKLATCMELLLPTDAQLLNSPSHRGARNCHQPIYRYRYGLDERLGDFAKTETSATSDVRGVVSGCDIR